MERKNEPDLGFVQLGNNIQQLIIVFPCGYLLKMLAVIYHGILELLEQSVEDYKFSIYVISFPILWFFLFSYVCLHQYIDMNRLKETLNYLELLSFLQTKAYFVRVLNIIACLLTLIFCFFFIFRSISSLLAYTWDVIVLHG